jgi:FKBP-type peptidyl-prolyl cis-trans isomerase FklB
MRKKIALRRGARLALSCLALAVLGGCNKPANTEAAKDPHYDLSPEANARYLADFAAKPGVTKTDDGLEYRVIKAGTGKAPQSGADMVTVKYKGALINGKVFDEHDDAVDAAAGKTATFPAGALIPGWVEALSLMKEGDEWELALPSDLGYGSEGAGKDIPGNQTLVFTMTLVSVAPAQ